MFVFVVVVVVVRVDGCKWLYAGDVGCSNQLRRCEVPLDESRRRQQSDSSLLEYKPPPPEECKWP